ncbi:hypothetical protein [Aquimarina algicola]|uniref:Uncharacterized protein n=1 Tax=Aquimarina algicola TaxID=2589995 RepID=A0A504J9E6_9FLAO|nr:hypothetical protein [Aquimarina algicola]TPN87546.1 hypothetical protein FHK87_08155 [Aquimarina algicola]
MGKAGKIWFISALILFIAFMAVMIQTFRPVRNVQPEDVIKIEGIVTDIKEAPGYDIAITIKDDVHYYYINRGLQQGLNIENLRNQLIDQKITLYALKRWTIFTRDYNMGHVSKLIFNDSIIYNEIKNDSNE